MQKKQHQERDMDVFANTTSKYTQEVLDTSDFSLFIGIDIIVSAQMTIHEVTVNIDTWKQIAAYWK